jgi:hypothetical protein
VTIGWIPQKRREKTAKEKQYDQNWRNHNDYLQTLDYCQRNYQGLGLGQEGAKEYLKEIGLDRHEEYLLAKQDVGDRPTFTATDSEGEYEAEIIDPRQPYRKRKRKGTKGIGSYGTKTVRSGCHIMQSHFGRSRLGFLTLTLPDHPDYLAVWCEQWSEIVRKFNQELQRELERQGAPSHVVAVTEIQTKRSKQKGYPVPHLHSCYVAWNGKSYIKGAKNTLGGRKKAHYISHRKMQEIFARILANEIEAVTGIACNISEINPRVEVKAVKKSAEGYLGKYMSKGGKDVKQFIEADPRRTDLPTHWWHCTKELRRIIKGLVTELPPAMLEAALTQMADLISLGIVQYARAITKVINGKERLLGWAFRFAPDYNPTDQNQIALAFSTS